MSTINVIICPKEELGFDSSIIRPKFNALAQVLQSHDFALTAYLDDADIAQGTMPEENLAALKQELDPQGFEINREGIMHAISHG